ncbi:MAG: SapC family protein [Pseudomonadota bacterium]
MSKKKTETETKSAGNGKGGEAQATGLPPLYTSVALINAEAHGKMKFKAVQNYKFAKNANSVVLAAVEFSQAAAHYPIVFGKSGDDLIAHAVLGHTKDENLYVNGRGKWRENTYIPAYVRRYPFLLLESKEDDRLSLLADTESGFFNEKNGDALYDGDKPTEAAEQALKFCVDFHREILKTHQLLKQISDADILVERNADVSLPDEKKARIAGFLVVDEEKLGKLEDEKFLELRRTGALNLIYSHLWSMRSWNNLLG